MKLDSATTWNAQSPDSCRALGARPTYRGPLAVLASSATAGAAEEFLAVFRALRRGVIVGEPSAGDAGDAATFTLPKSWAVAFSVTRHAAPDGAPLAGVGVPADLSVAQRVSGLLAGRHPPLEGARRHVSGQQP